MPKLMTEKPKFFLQNKKALAGRSSYTGALSNMRNIFLGLASPTSDLCLKPEKIDFLKLRSNSEFSPDLPPKSEKIEIPKLSSDSERASEPEKNDSEYAYLNNVSSITIENVPTTIDLVQLMLAISKYGKISSASMQTLPEGLRCCDVEFEVPIYHTASFMPGTGGEQAVCETEMMNVKNELKEEKEQRKQLEQKLEKMRRNLRRKS